MQIRYRLAFDGVCRLEFGIWCLEVGDWRLEFGVWKRGYGGGMWGGDDVGVVYVHMALAGRKGEGEVIFLRRKSGGTKKSYYHFHVAGAELGT